MVERAAHRGAVLREGGAEEDCEGELGAVEGCFCWMELKRHLPKQGVVAVGTVGIGEEGDAWLTGGRILKLDVGFARGFVEHGVTWPTTEFTSASTCAILRN